VLIEDFCLLPPMKAVEVMELSMAKDIGLNSGEWHASAHELLLQLQESCATMEGGSIICTIHSLLLSLGAVRLSYPDLTDPQYHQYFVKMVGGESFADAEFPCHTGHGGGPDIH
jgi:hypothetical protein